MFQRSVVPLMNNAFVTVITSHGNIHTHSTIYHRFDFRLDVNSWCVLAVFHHSTFVVRLLSLRFSIFVPVFVLDIVHPANASTVIVLYLYNLQHHFPLVVTDRNNVTLVESSESFVRKARWASRDGRHAVNDDCDCDGRGGCDTHYGDCSK